MTLQSIMSAAPGIARIPAWPPGAPAVVELRR